MINGVINVYKEKGYTSFDVVAKLRGILKQKKIGHTGTLDPMAEGVLLVCLGTATKLVDMITSGDKEYRAVMKLGLRTDTEDITGEITSECLVPEELSVDTIKDIILSYVGTYNQIPPMYSALKKNGKKLYEYARQGITIEREPREVHIYSIDDIDFSDYKAQKEISFLVRCSKGTYIRSLCRDIGDKLGCGAVMSGLIRENVHGFRLENAFKLSEIEALYKNGALEEHLLTVDSLLTQYKIVYIKHDYDKALINGNKLKPQAFGYTPENCIKETVRVYNDEKFMALYTYQDDEKIYKPYKMFLDN